MAYFETADGVSLYYRVKGDGVPIIFIHPPLLTSENFTYQVDELSKSYKVITFDIRGHGKSYYSSVPLTYPLISEDIQQLLDHLGIDKTYVCGYSTGGSIVLEFLLTLSERALGGIIVSGMSEAYGVLKDKIELGRSLAAQDAVPLIALSVSKTNSNNNEMFQLLLTSSLKGNAINIEQYYAYSLKYNCTNQLHTINLPVLLVYGKKDHQFHPYAKLLHRKLEHNQLKIIDHVKHQIPTKAANELNQFIKEFISNQ
ncbi:alpha/beta fold hydrolase [Fictibacillus halophilus]|uniref:alpha/beta fold hydrolase n=1 Tax=Fictibacillus halophilus TaxID=1610490 RepID=UPI0036374EA6